MAATVIDPTVLERIRNIHRLSQTFNEKVGREHKSRLLELMREHIDEIDELWAAENPHFLVETGDLIILCFEVLLEKGVSIDEIVEKCFGRYEQKLTNLIDSLPKTE